MAGKRSAKLLNEVELRDPTTKKSLGTYKYCRGFTRYQGKREPKCGCDLCGARYANVTIHKLLDFIAEGIRDGKYAAQEAAK